MTGDLLPYGAITPLEVAGSIANDVAKEGLLEEYHRTLTIQTLRRQQADLTLFKQYLESASIPSGDFLLDTQAWRGVTWGIIKGFREWMLKKSYAIGSINVRLSTVKKYAAIAFNAGVIDEESIRLIHSVKGFHGKVARNVDESRVADGLETRTGAKKAHPTRLSPSHMKALKERLEQDTSPIGRRDYLLVCLLGYQGFRCGEVASLRVSDVYQIEGLIIFYRRKVDVTQMQRMHSATLIAMKRYIERFQPIGMLFSGIDHDAWTDHAGKYHKAHKAEDGLSVRSINACVRRLGESIGIGHLSPHDLRHYWTFDAFQHKTPIDVIMQAGGWNSYAMPLHYRGEATVANEGIIQSE